MKAFNYRFTSKNAWLAFATAQGWYVRGDDVDVPDAAVDVIGPLMSTPSIQNGQLVHSEVVDPRFHLNILWYKGEQPAAIAGREVTPATPTRVFALPVVAAPGKAAPPRVIPAWKGKLILRRLGHMASVKAKVQAVGGEAEQIWQDADEWRIDSTLVTTLAAELGFTAQQVAVWFSDADNVRG